MSRLRTYHPVLLGIFPPLFLFSQNIREIRSPSRVAVLCLICCAAALAVWGIVNLLVRNARKSGLMASLACFLFFSYGYFLKLVWGARLAFLGMEIGRNLLLTPIWLLMLVFGLIWLGRRKGELVEATRLLNAISLGLIAIPLANTAIHGVSVFGRDGIASVESRLQKRPNPPDVYYIVPDRYANQSTFQSVFGYDNSPFLDSLTARGFYVVPQGRCNYPRTSLSLASSLNMVYLDSLVAQMGERASDYRPVMAMMSDNRVMRFFKKLGYVTVNVGSWYQGTDVNPHADLNLKHNMISEFTIVLLRSTLAYPFLEKFGITSKRLSHYKATLRQFEFLQTIPDMPEPTFVFAHTLITHAPFVFDREGNLIPGDPVLTGPLKKERYVEQLRYANKVLLATVDSILAKSNPKPVIILQSDEGPFPDRAENNYLTFDWAMATDWELLQKTGIFNAVLMPGEEDGLYPAMTPVNTFRYLFDRYFGGKFGLLPDRVFVNRKENRPYDLIDVTERVGGTQNQEVVNQDEIDNAHRKGR